MNKVYAVAILSLTCLLGFGVKAHAQDAEVSVTVSFEFVAGGQTLPANKYIVGRNSDDGTFRHRDPQQQQCRAHAPYSR
jgi:hypothetical protein